MKKESAVFNVCQEMVYAVSSEWRSAASSGVWALPHSNWQCRRQNGHCEVEWRQEAGDSSQSVLCSRWVDIVPAPPLPPPSPSPPFHSSTTLARTSVALSSFPLLLFIYLLRSAVSSSTVSSRHYRFRRPHLHSVLSSSRRRPCCSVTSGTYQWRLRADHKHVDVICL